MNGRLDRAADCKAGDSNVPQWFKKFGSGDFCLKDASRTGRAIAVQDNNLKALLEAELSQTIRGIAEEAEVNRTAVVNGLKRIGKKRKFEKWVNHELNER
ncbi:hypothetical protein OESDEN_16271 [Oesophagostomum dentatum]|uniref:Mos1 transposase HTH domain-containing protein n=1 Tax=Oesophagostomum dentatum TaxID=61180 RepID=A0A0B1SGH3_OESDE|nr:hypothetical protein OESDEN_16271 [Oesophagostomum dentatum]